ncbi:MAG: hypothetical protein F6K24_26490 [Okeania sp. SIO2D1]|nr:hypothetical protein [Okeania sp. SIO2D1]
MLSEFSALLTAQDETITESEVRFSQYFTIANTTESLADTIKIYIVLHIFSLAFVSE